MTRSVAIFSGSRAELALQLPILRACEADPRLEAMLILGGAHTARDAVHPDDLRDVPVAGRVFELPNEGRVGTPQAIATGILSASDVLGELEPDWLVVYGDRFESFATLIAASQMGIPVAHVEGGDYTAGGCLDDAVRHAMTKLAHLHFTTNQQATDRIVRMGEEPWRVHTVGLPSLDAAAAGDYPGAHELASEMGLSLEHPIVLFCMHPVPGDAADQVRPALTALAMLALEGCQVVALQPNNDAGGQKMRSVLRLLTASVGAQLHENLGRRRFHGMLNMMGCRSGFTRGALVGNSSAGIKEAPWFGCPTVNIGGRQRGRLRGDNVWDVPSEAGAIVDAVHAALKARLPVNAYLYGSGNACKQIAETLATVQMGGELLRKGMTY